MTKTAEDTLKQSAIIRQDEIMMRKISGEDLVAKEAHYHEECRKGYTRTCDNVEKNHEDEEWRKAHQEAFSIVTEYIETEIIGKSTVVRITMLKDKYQSYLKIFYPKFFNAEYPNQKLKNKIQRHFDHRILFFQPKYESEIVYSSTKILEKETESADSTWPPSSDYLHSCPVPDDLTIFLQRMFFPNVRDNI